jgi:hypothetical protein
MMHHHGAICIIRPCTWVTMLPYGKHKAESQPTA